MRPVIAVTLDYRESADHYDSPCAYCTSVEAAGGLPVLLPFRTDVSLIDEYLDKINGILFTGGDDLDPALYGEALHPKAIPIDPVRQKFELALLAAVERCRLPALGICCGSQLMNVHRGGSLIQFLPDEPRPNSLDHRKAEPQLKRHPVALDPASGLGVAIGKPTISVNTSHKQSVRRIGRGLRVIATAPDGVIEGFEDPTFPLFAAVQWHPERLSAEPEHLALFKLLVEKSSHRP